MVLVLATLTGCTELPIPSNYCTPQEIHRGYPEDWDWGDDEPGQPHQYDGNDASGAWSVEVETLNRGSTVVDPCLFVAGEDTGDLQPAGEQWSVRTRVRFSLADGAVEGTHTGKVTYIGPHPLGFQLAVDLDEGEHTLPSSSPAVGGLSPDGLDVGFYAALDLSVMGATLRRRFRGQASGGGRVDAVDPDPVDIVFRSIPAR